MAAALPLPRENRLPRNTRTNTPFGSLPISRRDRDGVFGSFGPILSSYSAYCILSRGNSGHLRTHSLANAAEQSKAPVLKNCGCRIAASVIVTREPFQND